MRKIAKKKKLKRYEVVDHNLKHLKDFDRKEDAMRYIKRHSPKDPRLSYGLYQRRRL